MRLVNEVYHAYNRNQFPAVVLCVTVASGKWHRDIFVNIDNDSNNIGKQTLILLTSSFVVLSSLLLPLGWITFANQLVFIVLLC